MYLGKAVTEGCTFTEDCGDHMTCQDTELGPMCVCQDSHVPMTSGACGMYDIIFYLLLLKLNFIVCVSVKILMCL